MNLNEKYIEHDFTTNYTHTQYTHNNNNNEIKKKNSRTILDIIQSHLRYF